MINCAVIVVAAGKGHRFGGDLPKQYNMLNGIPVLKHCLSSFVAHPLITSVTTVINPDDLFLYQQASNGLSLNPPVNGGKTRQESVRLGLESLRKENPDIVLIHDGARPFVDTEIINSVLLSLKKHKAVIPAIAVADTLKKCDNNQAIIDTIDRTNLFRAQTPQGFCYKTILEAHKNAIGLELTDDASVIENYGHKVFICNGAEDNFKITTKTDLLRAEQRFYKQSEIRIGSGFDVHALVDGDEINLCGIAIPHNKSLKGHSDADVALHAITDAILGAINAGDIGNHFPPSDNKWKGAKSEIFLKFAGDLLKAKNGIINNIDVTIMCEQPKIGKHKLEMTNKVAEILDISPNKVSIKGTTTEKLGFTGREEGIACQATTCISLPL